MRIVIDRPPMYAEICARFPAARNTGTIFTWGDTIYTPGNANVTKALMAHEEIHGARQGSTDEQIKAWWRNYLDDAGFRLEEEYPAHRAEYLAYCKHNESGRGRYLRVVAERLSGPLYGGLVRRQEAIQWVLTGNRPESVVKA